MRYSNQQKTIALVVGVLAMVFSISLIIWAWTEPGVIPPGGNVPAPINVGSTPQTKFGNLTLQNLYLNATGYEGDVYNADEIIGYGDLILRGKAGNAAPIYLEGTSVIINNDAGTGNVGIGTTNPVAKLQISGNITNNYFRPLYIQMNATVDNVHTAAFANAAGYGVSIGAYNGDIGMGSVNARKFTSGMGDTIANLILQREGGNVGIGTTNPVAKLAVGGIGSVGDAIAAYSNGECSAIYGEQLGSIGYAGYFSGKVYMSGDVGIGTTEPTNILSLGNAAARKFWIENSAADVVGRVLTVAAGGTITGTSVSNVAGGDLILQAGLGTGTGASTISFQTGTTLTTGMTLQTMSTKMTILGNGNVGIGTTGPGQKLDVNGNIRVRGITNCDQLGTDPSGNLICILPACLEEGSLALTPDGFRKIEELKVGDEVIGYKDGEKVAAKITKTSVHDGSWTMYYYKGYWFTGNHKVYTDYEHFEEVSKLSDVTKEYTGKVYDITVEETQNYFGENGLLIHNK